MTAPTRDRILGASAELFRRYGYTGTGLKQVVVAAGAPFGSLYHHFPGGKEQLGAETIRTSGRMYLELFQLVMDTTPDVVAGLELFFDAAAQTLRESGYQDACPIATVALEVASTSETLRVATAEVFESWLAEATRRLTAAGIDDGGARDLAQVVVCALEGAFILCRAMRRTDAMDAAGRASVAAVREALAQAQRARER